MLLQSCDLFFIGSEFLTVLFHDRAKIDDAILSYGKLLELVRRELVGRGERRVYCLVFHRLLEHLLVLLQVRPQIVEH